MTSRDRIGRGCGIYEGAVDDEKIRIRVISRMTLVFLSLAGFCPSAAAAATLQLTPHPSLQRLLLSNRRPDRAVRRRRALAPSSPPPSALLSFARRESILSLKHQSANDKLRVAIARANESEQLASTLQTNLDAKDQELALALDKMMILEDVVLKLKLARDAMADDMEALELERGRAVEASQREAVALENKLRGEIEGLTERLGREKRLRKNFESENERLAEELRGIRQELEIASSDRAEIVAHWEKKLSIETKKRKNAEARHGSEIEEFETELVALRNETTAMEGSLVLSEQQVEDLRKQLEAKGSELDRSKEEGKTARLRHEKEVDNLRSKLAAARENFSRESKGNDDGAEESIEIAKAAVKAADKRESNLRQIISDLESDLGHQQKENANLKLRLKELSGRELDLQKRIEDEEWDSLSTVDSLATKLREAERALCRSQEETRLTCTERDRAREALVAERVRNSAAERSLIGGEGPGSAYANSNKKNDRQGSQEREQPSKIRKVWKRIKSPRRWFVNERKK